MFRHFGSRSHAHVDIFVFLRTFGRLCVAAGHFLKVYLGKKIGLRLIDIMNFQQWNVFPLLTMPECRLAANFFEVGFLCRFELSSKLGFCQNAHFWCSNWSLKGFCSFAHSSMTPWLAEYAEKLEYSTLQELRRNLARMVRYLTPVFAISTGSSMSAKLLFSAKAATFYQWSTFSRCSCWVHFQVSLDFVTNFKEYSDCFG